MHDLITFILVAIAVDVICSSIAQRTANEIQRRQQQPEPPKPKPAQQPEWKPGDPIPLLPTVKGKITDMFTLP